MQNYQATGFNGYLNSLKTACPNLQIGANDIGLWLQYGGVTDNYSYWLDMTSRLYYGRIGPATYRSAVTGQLGPRLRQRRGVRLHHPQSAGEALTRGDR